MSIALKLYVQEDLSLVDKNRNLCRSFIKNEPSWLPPRWQFLKQIHILRGNRWSLKKSRTSTLYHFPATSRKNLILQTKVSYSQFSVRIMFMVFQRSYIKVPQTCGSSWQNLAGQIITIVRQLHDGMMAGVQDQNGSSTKVIVMESSKVVFWHQHTSALCFQPWYMNPLAAGVGFDLVGFCVTRGGFNLTKMWHLAYLPTPCQKLNKFFFKIKWRVKIKDSEVLAHTNITTLHTFSWNTS